MEELRKIDSLSIIKNNFKYALSHSIQSADETVLNVLFYDKSKLISEAWNYCYNREYGFTKLHEKRKNI